MKDKIHVKDQFCAGPNCDCRPTNTPTPWFNWGTDHQGRRPTICSKAPGSGYSVGSEIASVNTDADAAFIVRAVNSHEELIGMLKAALNNLDDQSGGYLTRDIEQAVAKAEGGL